MILLAFLPVCNAYPQAQELQQLALNIEKLAQFREILKDMKKGYEILTKGYAMVKDLTEGNFKLHQVFLDALLEVSPTVRNYKKVAEVVSYQVQLVQEFSAALDRFRGSGDFNAGEVAYLEQVYDNLLEQSLRNLDELTVVITAGELRMSDSERLEAIDRIHSDMQDKLMFLRDFNNNTSVLALQRARERKDVNALRSIYRAE
jgi:DNA repair ATPase RecN